MVWNAIWHLSECDEQNSKYNFVAENVSRLIEPCRLIYATEDPFPLLILQDMRPEGYETQRSPPACLEDTKLIIRGLAQFHAASFYLAENVSVAQMIYSHSVPLII